MNKHFNAANVSKCDQDTRRTTRSHSYTVQHDKLQQCLTFIMTTRWRLWNR